MPAISIALRRKISRCVCLTRISGKSPLAAAIRDALSRLPKAKPYLNNGHLKLDNNAAERAMKPMPLVEKRPHHGLTRRRKIRSYRLYV